MAYLRWILAAPALIAILLSLRAAAQDYSTGLPAPAARAARSRLRLTSGGSSASPCNFFAEAWKLSASTPLPGSGIDIDKVPANVQTLGADPLWPRRPKRSVADRRRAALSQRQSEQRARHQFQPDFVYRGFEASPICGIPEGLAVYQNGVRINEAFGDTVNWDLIPQFAVDRMTLQGNNPVFGLNALGGAVTLDMKNGFNYHGTDVQALRRFVRRRHRLRERGRSSAISAFTAPSAACTTTASAITRRPLLAKAIWTLAGRMTVYLHLSASAADNVPRRGRADAGRDAGGGPEKRLHLSASRFTTRRNRFSSPGPIIPADYILFSGGVYYRHFHQSLVDGNTTDVGLAPTTPPFSVSKATISIPLTCSIIPLARRCRAACCRLALPRRNRLSDDRYQHGRQPACRRNSQSDPGPGNNLVVGATTDHSITDYSAWACSARCADLDVISSGETINQGLSPTASPPIEQPVGVIGTNTYFGMYATDTFDITPRLAATASGRFNVAVISLKDQTGMRPRLMAATFTPISIRASA